RLLIRIATHTRRISPATLAGPQPCRKCRSCLLRKRPIPKPTRAECAIEQAPHFEPQVGAGQQGAGAVDVVVGGTVPIEAGDIRGPPVESSSHSTSSPLSLRKRMSSPGVLLKLPVPSIR